MSHAVLLIAAGAWFAINMGASGLAPAFGPALGARVLSVRIATVAYAVFVVLGAVLLGSHVAKTLASGIVPAASFAPTPTLIVLVATNASLLLANLVGIPQSTSWVTVAAIVALGAFHGNVTTQTLTHRLIPAWMLLPLGSFVLSATAVRLLYPMYGAGRIHSLIHHHERLLRALLIASACYVALAIGANNVANAAGPLAAAGALEPTMGLLLLSPLFGIGAAVFSGPARTIARDVVPLGLLTAIVCNVIVASLLLVASRLGLPQSLVHLNAAAVLGVALVKEGRSGIFTGRSTKRMLGLWLVTPLLAAGLTVAGLAVMQ